MNIWVFCENIEQSGELIAKGIAFGAGDISAYIMGSKEEADSLYAQGASKVYYTPKIEGQIIEAGVATFASLIKGEDNVVLCSNTKSSKAFASLLGAKMKAGVITEAQNIEVSGDSIETSRIIYGGLAIAKDKINGNAIIILAPLAFKDAAIPVSKSGTSEEVAHITDPNDAIKCVKLAEKEASSVDLNKAKKIVGIGRGIKAKEDMALANTLCEAIDAELGCSRPIAESEKWMEHDRYIGISSAMPKPEVYIALGISGQIQHMVGIKDAGTIIAVNKDENAPIFEYADYGIVGDLYKVVPELNKALGK